MIELATNTALMLYLGMTLCGILGVWAMSHYRSRNRCFMPLEKELIVCEFCHFAYLDIGAKKSRAAPAANPTITRKTKIAFRNKQLTTFHYNLFAVSLRDIAERYSAVLSYSKQQRILTHKLFL